MILQEQFTEGTETTSGIEDIRSMRNVAEYDGDLYWTGYDGLTTNPWTQTLYTATSPTATPTALKTFSNSSRHASGNYNTYTYVNGLVIISMVAHEYIIGTYTLGVGIVYTLDGGSTWETSYEFQSNAVGGASPTYQGGVDAFKLTSRWNLCTSQSGSGPDVFQIYFRDIPYTGVVNTVMYGSQAMYAGCPYNSEYWFVYQDSAGDWQLASFDGSAITDEEELTIDTPSNPDLNYHQYWRQGNTELLIDPDYFRTRAVGDTVWVKYTAASPSTVTFIWNITHTEINYIVWNDSIWVWTEGGSIENMQEYSGDAYVGHDDWFCDGQYIWAPDYVDIDLTQGVITNRVMNYPLARIQSATAPFSDQWLQLYNSATELVYKGRVVKDSNDGSLYTYVMKSGIEEDFDIKITATYITKTIKEIVEDIIDNNFSHIWYDTGISNTNTDTFTKSFNGVGFKYVMKWASRYGGYITAFSPSYEIKMGAFLNSSEAISEAATTYGYSEVKYDVLHEKFSYIRLYGGYVDGIRLETTLVGAPNGGYWQDTFASITVQAELDDMAVQMLSDMNVEIQTIRFYLANRDQMYPGEYFSFTSARRSQTAQPWNFIEVEYDIRSGMQVIYASDSYWMPNPTKEEKIEDRITQNEQNIGILAEEAASNIADPWDAYPLDTVDNPKAYADCAFVGFSPTWTYGAYYYNEGYGNSGAGDPDICFNCPLPPVLTLGGVTKYLHIDQLLFYVTDADASNRITSTGNFANYSSIECGGIVKDGSTYTAVTYHTTAYEAAGAVAWTLGTEWSGESYDSCQFWIHVQGTTGGNFNMRGHQFRYWYEDAV